MIENTASESIALQTNNLATASISAVSARVTTAQATADAALLYALWPGDQK